MEGKLFCLINCLSVKKYANIKYKSFQINLMRFLFFLIIVFFISGCNSNNQDKNSSPANVSASKLKVCNNDYDSLLLKYANDFKASTIDLDESLSPQLDSFLLYADTNCLRKQKEYKTFISIILAKLCLHHLQCCNQGYDLLSMETQGAKVIVVDFRNMSGYQNKHLDMLNSEFIIDFIESDKKLKENAGIKSILTKINKEVDRIEKGNI